MPTALLERQPVREIPHRPLCGLEKVFAELGIKPFSRVSVFRYQRAQVSACTPLRTCVVRAVSYVLPYAFFGAVVLMILSLISHLVIAHLLAPWVWLAYLAVGSSLTLVGLIVTGNLLERCKVSEPTWISCPAENYVGYIPESARELMFTIKAQYPEARFFVESLVLWDRTFDPLLVVHDRHGYGDFIDVWNEPDFDPDC